MAKRTEPAPELKELMDRIAALPSLDELFARHPKTHTDEERRSIVEHMRLDRAMWEFKDQKRKDKAEGISADMTFEEAAE